MRNHFHKTYILLLAIVIVIMTTKSNAVISDAAKNNSRSISLNHASQTMYAGNSMKLKVKSLSSSNSSNITWTSSNKKIAIVSTEGKVTAKSPGSAIITAKLKSNKNIKASCKITIYDKTKNIELISDKNYTVSPGDVVNLQAVVTNSNKHTQPVSWKSSNKSIASVTKNGTVTAKRIGSVKMTASSGGKHVSVFINVQEHNSGSSDTPATPVIPPAALVTIYTVDFNSNGGTPVDPQMLEDGSIATRPSDPLKADYIFIGWFTDTALTAMYDFSLPVTANITLYAKWLYEPQNNCTITFHTNGEKDK